MVLLGSLYNQFSHAATSILAYLVTIVRNSFTQDIYLFKTYFTHKLVFRSTYIIENMTDTTLCI